MKILKYVLISLLAMTSPLYATSNEMMLDMIEWIEKNSKYKYNGEKLPWIEIRTQEEICEVLFENPPENCIAIAYYDHNLNAIFLSPDPIGKMVQEKFIEVIIFHELVHFLQYTNGEDEFVLCENALELDAYKLQDKYVEEMGWPDEQRPNMLFAYLVSSCRQDHFSNER
jgi:hypothetical protein